MYCLSFRSCPAFVLALGLVSCNQKSLSTLNVPAPTWETEVGQRSFSLTDTHVRELTITDRLSFANSPAAVLRANTRCTQGTRSFSQTTQFSLPAKIPLFSFLPVELLRPPRLDSSTECSISFVAQDSSGASHSFAAKNFLLRNSKKSIGIEALSETTVFRDSDFAKEDFRLYENQVVEVRLLCEDFSIATRHNEHQRLNLSEFVFPPEFMKGRTNQKCRLIGLLKEQIVFTSKELVFRFGQELPVFETKPLPPPGEAPSPKRDYAIYSFRISNPTVDHLQMRFPKSNVSKFVHLKAVTPPFENMICPNYAVARFPMENLKIVFPPKTEVREKDGYYQFELPSGRTIEGILTAQITTIGAALQVLTSEPLEIFVFYGDDWQPVGVIPWTIKARSTWNSDPKLFPASWPCRY